jgi:hypothetical protein
MFVLLRTSLKKLRETADKINFSMELDPQELQVSSKFIANEINSFKTDKPINE